MTDHSDPGEALSYHLVARATRSAYREMARLRQTRGNWAAAYAELRDRGAALGDPREESEKLRERGIRIILQSEEAYPEPLRHIPSPPFALYLRGAAAALGAGATTLAIVGTRRPGHEGRRIAEQFSGALAAAGYRIASGLAFGIDRAAHEGCLAAGGVTVAALAGGMDAVYPGSHEPLARQILAQGGALISEYPPNEPPYGYRFLERNRIISGIARGVIVIEAPESSGALATARYAAEQNRDLFVVPGSAAAPNFRGSHALIRQGAELVTSPDEILQAYGAMPQAGKTHAVPQGANREESLVLRALAEAGIPLQVDKLSATTRLEPRIVNRTLTFLLLRGIVKEREDGYTI